MDQIVGIAVLDKTSSPEELHILCQTAAGRRLQCSIPVYPAGTPKSLADQWKYTVVGDRLEVTPSVNWIGHFHNSGNWTVQFVIFDPKEYQSAADKFRAVNTLQL